MRGAGVFCLFELARSGNRSHDPCDNNRLAMTSKRAIRLRHLANLKKEGSTTHDTSLLPAITQGHGTTPTYHSLQHCHSIELRPYMPPKRPVLAVFPETCQLVFPSSQPDFPGSQHVFPRCQSVDGSQELNTPTVDG